MERMIKSELTIKEENRVTGIGRLLKLSLLMIVACFFIVPSNAIADRDDYRGHRERFVLDYGDSFYRGRPGDSARLYLKRALKRQYPGVDVSDYRLKKVVLVAKTKHGKGRAQLRVGPEVSDLYRVNGHPHDFQSDRRYTYDKVRIRNPFRDSWGPWQLLLRGKFKVDKVVLVVEKRHPHKYGRIHGDRYDWRDKRDRRHRDHFDWRSQDGSIYFRMNL